MTNATEIKLEDDRDGSGDGFPDRWRGMKLVPARKVGNKDRPFNIDVPESLFSPHVSGVDRPGSTRTHERRFGIESRPSGRVRPVSGTLGTGTILGIFITAGVLGFLIGRRRG